MEDIAAWKDTKGQEFITEDTTYILSADIPNNECSSGLTIDGDSKALYECAPKHISKAV